MKHNNIIFLPVANGDSILLLLNNYTILIDGGFSNTYKILKRNLIANKIKTIDLAILTHSDSDHIGGIIRLIQDRDFYIKNIWFNSHDKLSQFFNKGKKDTTKDITVYSLDNEVSYVRAKKLSKLLDEEDKEYEIIYTEKFENYTYSIEELEFIFLSPTVNNLYKLYKSWSIEEKKENRIETSVLAEDFQSIEDCAKRIEKCKPDDSLQNGSSIAFVLKYKEKKFLFLGDAHIDVIVESLKSLGFNSTNNRLFVDFIKLSHHGSRSNICQEFLDIVDSNKYIISTNGKSHNHPDMETLCLIIVDAKAKGKKIKLIFNYPNHTYSYEKNILKKKFNREHYGYDLIFADDIQKGYTFEF